MEEIQDFMKEIDLINSLEIISSRIPDKLLKLEGYLRQKSGKEQLEVIIFKGFSSSTTHPIEINLEKKVIEFDHSFTNFKLFMAPLKQNLNGFIRENKDPHFFLNPKNWI